VLGIKSAANSSDLLIGWRSGSSKPRRISFTRTSSLPTGPCSAGIVRRIFHLYGASRIIYTDISRDGTREGVNLDETLKIARAVKIPIIASGGVATLDDIHALKPLEKEGVEGVIVGRALYAAAFTLRQAIQTASRF